MLFKELEKRGLPPILAESTTAENWWQRRKELIELFAREEYGFSPEPPPYVRAETTFLEERAWAGKAEHREVALQFPTPRVFFHFQLILFYLLNQKRCHLSSTFSA